MKKRWVMVMAGCFILLINIKAQIVNVSDELVNKKQTKESNLKGQFVTITNDNGSSFIAYTAGPKNAEAGILVVHDYFGISDATKKSVEQLGDLGNETIAVDLYKGKSATTNDSAVLLMNAKDSIETTNILRAGIHYLEKPERKLAAIGFSAGGIDAMNAALLEPDLFKATIIVYGGNYDKIEKAKIEKLKSPVLAITGSLDKWPLDAALNFLGSEKEKRFELYVISGVDHGFAQPLFNQGKNYNEEATKETWFMMKNFLSRNLN
jgi:carboxymethylenebutenolidase